ncbi:hypothetical protein QL996_15410 [Planococcus sp. APC 4015]|nr:hypothetical protein [Planococcus sp. APC 4015]
MSTVPAFGPDSPVGGALLPREGRDALIRSLGMPPGLLEATVDGWLTPEIPILVRGSVRILPVAWWGARDRGDNPHAHPVEIDAVARQLQDMGMYAAGPWKAIDLSASADDSLGSYAAALRAAGATRADRFVYVQHHLGLVVVRAGDERDGTRSLAVHIVPEAWVFLPAAGGPVADIDVRWSWVDVVDLARGS